MKESITMKPVSNSNQVSEYGYSAESNTLAVRFKNGGMYHYHDVPERIAKGFDEAESKGSYLHSHIKPTFKYSRIDDKKERES